LITVRVTFYSYFRELAGQPEATLSVAPGSRISELLAQILERFPKMRPMQKSMLIAVGVEYQRPEFALSDGDEVALFPPVQGG